MIIWGGFSGWEGEPIMEAQGERYDPSNDTWTPVSTIAQPPLTAEHSAVWTGSRMIVWGGWDQLLPWQDAVHAVASGGLYDPATDAWAPISTIGAPDPRVRHTALWTGRDMVVWGGNRGVKDELSNGDLDSGARYDPIGDTWEPTGVDAFTPAPASRHTAVWTESEMIVWGGSSGSAAGGLYCAGIPAVSHRDDDGSGAPLVAK
jgi:N-acetylneuraminic acid mutarotase